MTVEVAYLANGIVHNETLTAPKISWQIMPSGVGQVTLYAADGGTLEDIGYRRVKRVRRVRA